MEEDGRNDFRLVLNPARFIEAQPFAERSQVTHAKLASIKIYKRLRKRYAFSLSTTGENRKLFRSASGSIRPK